MKYIEYFTISQYLPDGVYQQQKELARYLRNSHYSKRGLHSTEAEHNFIRYLQRMKDYGFHYLSGIWIRDDKIELNVYVGIGLNGICIFERYNSDAVVNAKRGRDIKKCNNKRLQYEQFDWLEIENLCFSKQIFCIVVRKLNINSNNGTKNNKDRVKFKIKMDNRKWVICYPTYTSSWLTLLDIPLSTHTSNLITEILSRHETCSVFWGFKNANQ